MTFRTAAVSMTFWVLGCASTNVQATWKADQPPPQQIHKFVVFGVTGSPSGRISFEETLTKSLQQAGLPAIPGYDFVAYDEYPDRSEVTRRLQEKGVDGVLVTRIESQTDDIQSTPVIVATGVPAYGYYDYWMAPAVAYGTYTTETHHLHRLDRPLRPHQRAGLLDGAQQHHPDEPREVRHRHRAHGCPGAEELGLHRRALTRSSGQEEPCRTPVDASDPQLRSSRLPWRSAAHTRRHRSLPGSPKSAGWRFPRGGFRAARSESGLGCRPSSCTAWGAITTSSPRSSASSAPPGGCSRMTSVGAATARIPRGGSTISTPASRTSRQCSTSSGWTRGSWWGTERAARSWPATPGSGRPGCWG